MMSSFEVTFSIIKSLKLFISIHSIAKPSTNIEKYKQKIQDFTFERHRCSQLYTLKCEFFYETRNTHVYA